MVSLLLRLLRYWLKEIMISDLVEEIALGRVITEKNKENLNIMKMA